jgi:shikimate dehydrogenase
LYGYNTDADGFLKPLKDRVGDLRGLRVAVAGAGGAARACLYSLAREGADISLFARDEVKAMALSNEIEAGFEKLPAGRAGAFDNFDIVVNTTPLGTRGELETSTIAVAEQLKNVKLVYDLVYNPPATRLLREALAAGAVTLGGFDMLIEQARRQFEIWTGRTPPSSIMAAAARKALNES